MSTYQIPISQEGNMMRYAEPSGYYEPSKWIENHEWEDVLEYNGYGRGRSAAYFYLTSKKTKKNFFMFMTDFDDAVKHFAYGLLEGKFTFVKRGKNYGIKKI